MVGTEIRDPSPVAPTKERHAIWFASIGIGSVLSLIGSYGLGSIWISADLGNLSWEFEAIANTFKTLVIPTLGLAMVGLGLLRNSYAMACKVLAILCLAIVAFLSGILLIYIVDLPDAIRDARIPVGEQNMETTVTFALAIALIGFYAWGAWYLRSRTRHIY